MKWEKKDLSDVPMTPSGVGGYVGQVRWCYSEYGQFLTASSIRFPFSITFNLKDFKDIESRLKYLHKAVDGGLLDAGDVAELEERVRTLSDFYPNTHVSTSMDTIGESTKHKKGSVYYTYTDGKKIKHIARGKMKLVSTAKKRAALNASKYAHTVEANKKRRKSIKAKREDSALGL